MITPTFAQRAYRMARWRISARGATRGADGWGSFKSLASQQTIHNASEYTNFLRKADPSLKLPHLTDAHFFGEGMGEWNINLYRIGKYNDQPVFEKTYFSDSEAMQKLEWFHEVVLPELDQSLSTPPILFRADGDCLTVLYFPLLELGDPVPDKDLLNVALALQHAVACFRWSGTDPNLNDFRQSSSYREHRKAFLQILNRNGRDLSKVFSVEEWLQRPEVPHRFSHGDLSPDNVRTCGTFLDFDHCGFFPAGYDCGATLRRSQTPTNVQELEFLVDRQLAPECKSTQLSMIFFMAVFSSIGVVQKTNGQLNETLVLDVWDCVLRRLDRV